MVLTITKTASQLDSVINEAREWLLDLDENVVRHKPTPDRWSIAEVIGHMVDSACNNHQRFVRAQESTELSFPGYEQNIWVARANYQESDWSSLVELWHSYNVHLAHVIRNIPEAGLKTPCTITPNVESTLGFLITDYLVHLKHHLGKIRERI